MIINEKHNEVLIAQTMDLEKFFDKEQLLDVLNEAYKNKVKGKPYRLLYQLNKKRVIKVVTAVGESDEEEVGEGLGQGTLESAILSAGSISNGLEDFFNESPYELNYLGARVQPISHQDDIMRLSNSIENTRAGISKLETMAETKILNYNPGKSSLIILGKKKPKEKMEMMLKENPVLLYGKPMNIKMQEKYLGEQICSTTEESIIATIKKRKGLAILAINDIASVVSDARANLVGGIQAALMIWEQAVLPFLLNSSDTWIGISKSALNLFSDIHNLFLRRVLKVGKSCQKALMYFDLGQLLMNHRISKNKMLFLKHIAGLEEKALAKIFYEKQKIYNVPSLLSECSEDFVKIGVTINEMEDMSKGQWKQTVSQYFKLKNEEELLNMMAGSHKVEYEKISKEKCEVKDYMKELPYNGAIVKFRLRAKLFPTIKSHFKNNREYEEDLYSCPEGCVAVDTTRHIERCPKYADLREGFCLDRDSDLVSYFQLVLERRRKTEEDE